MLLDQVEKLKQELTDKYVVVDGSRPELRRFAGTTGQVRTVNMSGRALVEFDQYNNIGWYDINPAFLKVVDKPQPKPAEEKTARKSAPKAEAAPAKSAAPAKAAAAPAAAKKPSTADILAAARGKAAAKPAEAPATEGKKPSTAEILAAARSKGAAPAAPAPAEKAKLSTADILAAARGKAAPAAKAPPAAAPPRPPVEAHVPEPEPEPVVQAAPAPAAKAPVGKLPTATADIIAWCQAHDAKG